MEKGTRKKVTKEQMDAITKDIEKHNPGVIQPTPDEFAKKKLDELIPLEITVGAVKIKDSKNKKDQFAVSLSFNKQIKATFLSIELARQIALQLRQVANQVEKLERSNNGHK